MSTSALRKQEFDWRRRSLLMLLATLPAACITPLSDPRGRSVPPPAGQPHMRLPEVGQEWVYAVRNVYNQEVLDIVTERVVSVGAQVRIERTGQHAGSLPDEIQRPWGTIEQDPHWNPPQVFPVPIPLWPLELRAGWEGHFRREYQVLDKPDYHYHWSLAMHALGWEEIQVPAGQFRSLVFRNFAQFDSNELYYRLESERTEDIWLVPEIGRWAIRRSSGIYYTGGKGDDEREDFWEWQLQSWK
ncbi:MAG: hypothetical protein KGI47_08040 [Betaproteobacteria bacterium]|nr:hypothetical protein [Betaproteobacteria bacterium]MDE2622683.1 hypothetical protein [Betaproteobacteria bacterium]